MTRYFFNKETKECEAFDYGGCAGNLNNFETFEECENQCAIKTVARNLGFYWKFLNNKRKNNLLSFYRNW